jgi:hypothetical protein
MARAIEWAIGRSADQGGRFLVVNAGNKAGNYQVKELAEVVSAELPGTKVSVNRAALPDKRSYQVDFSLFASLAPEHVPAVSLNQSVRNLASSLREMRFSDSEFRASPLMRLRTLKHHIEQGRLSLDLRWQRPKEIA